MLNVNYIKSNVEFVKELVKKRSIDIDVDKFVEVCTEYGSKKTELDSLRCEQKNVKNIDDAKLLKKRIAALKLETDELLDLKNAMFAFFPNFLADDTPDGENDTKNVELRTVGNVRHWDFEPKSHEQIGEELKILDLKSGAKVAGSGFYYWLGGGTVLVNAVYRLSQDMLVGNGFDLVIPPVFAKKRTFFGTGYFPFSSDENYKIDNMDLYPIGTSEQTLVALHDGDSFSASDLPKCYSALTPCFRIESGSYGRESRGAFRVHQFNKIEQIVFCSPEDSELWHLKCLKNIEQLMNSLELPYRVVRVCVGDMGAPGYKKYDVEAWFPSLNKYRETHSNTNLTDFQTYRFNIKIKTKNPQAVYPHTISSTMATDRVVLAILENYQQSDGTVVIPKVLLPYTYGLEILGR